MVHWFWLWWIFSFFGYILEKIFARLTHAEKQNRKCFLLLPLCPVYGFSVAAVLALGERFCRWPWLLLSAALVPCAVEYLAHVYYERIFGVYYWDYRGVPGNLNGRICLPFALAWTALVPIAVQVIVPRILPLIDVLPPRFTFFMWMLLAADFTLSRELLLLWHDTERLQLKCLRQ